MKINHYLLFVLIIWVHLIQAEDQWTLKQCLQIAYKANHLLKAADFQKKQSIMQLKASQAQRLPVVSLNSGYTRVGRLSTIEFSTGPGEPPRKLTFGTPNRMNLALQLQMPLFTWWRIDHAIQISQLSLQLNDLEKEKQKISVTTQVLQAYYGALLAKKMLNLTEQNVQRTQKYLQITQKRFAAGQLPKFQLLRAQVQMQNDQSRLQTVQADYQKSLVFLAKVTGVEGKPIEPQGELQFTSLPYDEEEYLTRALSNRQELKQLDQQKIILQTQQKIVAAGNKPNLALVSNFSVLNGFNPMEPEKFYTNYNIGLQLSWPIFDSFNSHYQAKAVYYNNLALKEQKKEIEANIKLQIRQALISLEQAAQKIASQKANIELAQQALDLAQKQYDQGVVSSLDLIEAQKTLLQTEMGYWQAVFSHILNKIELAKAMADFSIFEDQL